MSSKIYVRKDLSFPVQIRCAEARVIASGQARLPNSQKYKAYLPKELDGGPTPAAGQFVCSKVEN